MFKTLYYVNNDDANKFISRHLFDWENLHYWIMYKLNCYNEKKDEFRYAYAIVYIFLILIGLKYAIKLGFILWAWSFILYANFSVILARLNIDQALVAIADPAVQVVQVQPDAANLRRRN